MSSKGYLDICQFEHQRVEGLSAARIFSRSEPRSGPLSPRNWQCSSYTRVWCIRCKNMKMNLLNLAATGLAMKDAHLASPALGWTYVQIGTFPFLLHSVRPIVL